MFLSCDFLRMVPPKNAFLSLRLPIFGASYATPILGCEVRRRRPRCWVRRAHCRAPKCPPCGPMPNPTVVQLMAFMLILSDLLYILVNKHVHNRAPGFPFLWSICVCYARIFPKWMNFWKKKTLNGHKCGFIWNELVRSLF